MPHPDPAGGFMANSSLGGIFDLTGVTRGPDGIKRYDALPANLVHMLRATVERRATAEAVAETGGGPRLSYRRVWGRSARGAGGGGGRGGRRGHRRRPAPEPPRAVGPSRPGGGRAPRPRRRARRPGGDPSGQ